MMFWGSYGMRGAIVNFIANFIIMAWIIVSYRKSFEYACLSGGLLMPIIFKKK